MKRDKCNILVLSAGRRVELINLFKRAAKKLNIESSIVAADCSNLAPALYFADKKVIIPRINSNEYIESLIEVVKKNNISIIIPTIDTELLVLAANKQYIENTTNAKVLISNYNVIDICRDKNKTQDFFELNGFKMPKRIEKKNVNEKTNFPLFVKPISGSSSINAYKVNSYDDFSKIINLVPNPIIQECIFGDEYTVDVFLDFDSNPVTIVPRLRIATRSGEIAKGRILKDIEIIIEIKKLLAILKPIGHITIQLMKTNDGIYFIEINPRFGGGAPMSIMSGADSCENIFRLLNNEKLIYNENYKENQTFLRFDSCVCIDDEYKVISND